jgi:hypothetical protein
MNLATTNQENILKKNICVWVELKRIWPNLNFNKINKILYKLGCFI